MQSALSFLESVYEDHDPNDYNLELMKIISKLYKRYNGRSNSKLSVSGIRKLRQKREKKLQDIHGALVKHGGAGCFIPFEDAPKLLEDDLSQPLKMNKSSKCHICKTPSFEKHFFYGDLCLSCGQLNWDKRLQSADLQGRTALVTGGRIKIGYCIALKLLRAGATVIVTTRFPKDALQRYENEEDYHIWEDRLSIHGLDFRMITLLQNFCKDLVKKLDRLDIIINNAAQTIQRPDSFYTHLLESKSEEPKLMIEKSYDDQHYFPSQVYDVDGQQVDLRPTNSWQYRSEDVSAVELLEVHIINSMAPFILVNGLMPLLSKQKDPRFVVNVSSMEGKFNRRKSIFHPHTNMAKASLNMWTRTSADDYALSYIFMTAVDTGWVTDESAHNVHRERFSCPLDEIDGAARVLDPVFQWYNQSKDSMDLPLWGCFLKDYKKTSW